MLLLVARRGIPVIHTGAHQGKVPYYKGSIFALLRLFVHYSKFSLLIKPFNATNAKITYLCNRFGLFGAAFLRNTAKPLFFLNSFFVSVFNAHRKKR